MTSAHSPRSGAGVLPADRDIGRFGGEVMGVEGLRSNGRGPDFGTVWEGEFRVSAARDDDKLRVLSMKLLSSCVF